MHAYSPQSCPTLCIFMDSSLPGSSVHGIVQARILERVAMPSSRGSSQPRDCTHVSFVSWIGRQGFTLAPPGKPMEDKFILKRISIIDNIYI